MTAAPEAGTRLYTVEANGRAVDVWADTPLAAVQDWCQQSCPWGRVTARVTAQDGTDETYTVEENPIMSGWDIRKEQEV